MSHQFFLYDLTTTKVITFKSYILVSGNVRVSAKIDNCYIACKKD